MLDVNALHKIRDERIEYIAAQKKPEKPRFIQTSIVFIRAFVIAVVCFVFFSIAYRTTQQSITYCLMAISLFLMLITIFASIYIYHNAVRDYKKVTKRWKKHKQNLIRETEAKFDDYTHQLLATGTIRTDDPYIKQALGLVPKCPTCGSTDIVPVSGIRRDLAQTAFGIANPTARAQFRCKNCGYKW